VEILLTELPLQRLLLDVIALLDQLRIPYALMGGFAVRTWGVPRPTYDADIAISVDEEGLNRLLQALDDAGLHVPNEHKRGFLDTVAGFRKLKVSHFEDRNVWDVDFFLVRGPFLESAFSRTRRKTMDQREINIMAPEDLILLKLIAFRRKDQLDIEEILKVASGLDFDYLRGWAAKLGLKDRLREFLP
jgi:hypothetical protein